MPHVVDSERRILELFSGIGGMHSAFKYSRLPGHVVAAIDINTVANTVYAHNHPDTKLLTRNIQKVNAAFVRKLRANTILMSPPCQPFTRTGKQQDVADKRTDALVHLCTLIGELETVDAILMENVKGFETSQARSMYLEALTAAGFHYQELIVSPSQLGVPNTRFRYYCIARKWSPFPFAVDGILTDFPATIASKCLPKPYGDSVAHYLDRNDESRDGLELPDDVLLKRARVLDIARADSERTMCFTKAYTHYTEGTGSVYCPLDAGDRIREIIDGAEDQRTLDSLRSLGLRYFSPYEVARLMCFKVSRNAERETSDDDECFRFPTETTKRQCYRLLGNSVNVYVVAELIRAVFEESTSTYK